MNTKEAREYLESVFGPHEVMPSGQPRARCRRCRNCLWEDGAYFGQFCDPDCAGIRAEVDAARAVVNAFERDYCPVCKSGRGYAKKIYRDFDEATADAARLTVENGKPYKVYTCRRGNRHVGSRESVPS